VLVDFSYVLVVHLLQTCTSRSRHLFFLALRLVITIQDDADKSTLLDEEMDKQTFLSKLLLWITQVPKFFIVILSFSFLLLLNVCALFIHSHPLTRILIFSLGVLLF